MNTEAATISGRTAGFKRATVRETAALLLVAWLIPFAVHLLPWSGARPLGAYLLPMFWATFVAAYFFGARLGVVVGLFAPVINLLVTGLPAWRFLSVMSVELAIFALVSAWAIRRWPRFMLIAPLAYVAAKMCSTSLQAVTGVFGDIGSPGSYFMRSLMSGGGGLLVLSVIDAALIWFYPKADAGTQA